MHKATLWDRFGKVDVNQDKVYTILRVLQFGTWSDFLELQKDYWMDEILLVAKENYFNLDDLTRNFLNIKYGLDLPLKWTLNEITSGYSLRFQEEIFVR